MPPWHGDLCVVTEQRLNKIRICLNFQRKAKPLKKCVITLKKKKSQMQVI